MTDEDEMRRLQQRVERLEREHEITIVRMGQMQSAFDTIFSAWQQAVSEPDAARRLTLLYQGWRSAAQRMPK